MTTGHLHLIRRGAVYYWRRRLPVKLVPLFGGVSHFSMSLGTREPFPARRLARKLSAVFDEVEPLLMKLKPPTESDLRRVLFKLFQDILIEGEKRRIARPEGQNPYAIDEDDTDEEREEKILMNMDHDADNWAEDLRSNDFRLARSVVDKALRLAGLEPPSFDDQYRVFLRKVMATIQKAHAYDFEREQGIYNPPVHPFLHEWSATPTVEVALDVSMSEAYEQFITSWGEGERTWKPATTRQARQAIKLWQDLIGDPPFRQVDRQDAFRFREALSKLPALVGKSVYSKDKPSEAILRRQRLARGKDHVPPEQLATISPKTVNKHVDFLNQFFEWKISKGELNWDHNPFRRIRYSSKHVQERANSRDLWTAEQLEALFQTAVWRGSRSAHFRSVSGDVVIEDAKFWVPLLGLFTGMREDEACSLMVADVSHDRDADCYTLKIREGKTRNARRIIPIHSELLKIGFIAYRDAVNEAGFDRLFPALSRRGVAQSFSAQFTKWFTEYRMRTKIYEKLRDFHSLRHTFDTAVENEIGNNTTVVRAIMGHAGTGSAAERYFRGMQPSKTRQVIDRLHYGLDLSHLYLENQPNRQRRFDDPWSVMVKKRNVGNSADS